MSIILCTPCLYQKQKRSAADSERLPTLSTKQLYGSQRWHRFIFDVLQCNLNIRRTCLRSSQFMSNVIVQLNFFRGNVGSGSARGWKHGSIEYCCTLQQFVIVSFDSYFNGRSPSGPSGIMLVGHFFLNERLLLLQVPTFSHIYSHSESAAPRVFHITTSPPLFGASSNLEHLVVLIAIVFDRKTTSSAT